MLLLARGRHLPPAHVVRVAWCQARASVLPQRARATNPSSAAALRWAMAHELSRLQTPALHVHTEQRAELQAAHNAQSLAQSKTWALTKAQAVALRDPALEGKLRICVNPNR